MGVAGRVLVSLFLVGASFTTPQLAIQSASQTIVENGVDGTTRGVNRILGGIISYTGWKGEPAGAPRTLCLVGDPRLTDRVAPTVAGGPVISVRRSTADGAMGGGCDIIFLGRMPVADRQRLIAWVRGRPVLTVTDDDPNCSFGAMFCLVGRTGSVSFSANLDAIARGQLRIDPRVLKIGSDGGAR